MEIKSDFSIALPFLLIFLLVFAIPAIAQKEAFLKKEFTARDGSLLPYRILYPENMQDGRQYPLILFLHGAGERGSDNEKQLIHGADLFLKKENRRQFPAIVVFPQCPENGWWVDRAAIEPALTGNSDSEDADYGPSTDMQRVIELMQELIENPSTSKNQVYVMGLSMGAFGIFDLLHRHPEWFAAAVPICGGGDYRKAEKYARRVSIWAFHGSEDNVVPVEASRRMVEAIEAAGGTIKYTEYQGVNHNSWDPAFAEDDLLSWIFSQRKK